MVIQSNSDGGTLMVEQLWRMSDWPLEKANFSVGLNPRFYYLELSRKS